MNIDERIEILSADNQVIIDNMNKINEEIKRLNGLRQQYINQALSNNGALQTLLDLKAETEAEVKKEDNVIDIKDSKKKA